MKIPNTPLNDNALDGQHALAGWTGSQGGAGIATCFLGHIQYALPDKEKQLVIATNNTINYQNTNKLQDLNNWSFMTVAESFPTSMRSSFEVGSPLSVVSLGEYNYFFWSNSVSGSWTYYVLRTSPDMLTPPAFASIDVPHNEEGNYQDYYGNMACFALPEQSTILTANLSGKIGCVLPFLYPAQPMSCHLQTLVLDPALFVANSAWPTQCYNDHTLALKDKTGNPLTTAYNIITAGWFDQGTGIVSGQGIPQANRSLVIWLSDGKNSISRVLDLDAAFSQAYNRDYHHTYTITASLLSNDLEVCKKTSVTLCQAPDGQLLALFVNNDKKVTYKVFTPATGQDSASWQPYAPMVGVTAVTSSNTPSTVFVPLASSVGESPVPVVPEEGGSKQTYKECRIQNYVQCVFSSKQNDAKDSLPQLNTAYWGCFFTIPGYSSHSRIGAAKMVASLIADTFPYPVPDPRVWGSDSPSGMINWLLCEYEYLVGNENEVDIDWNMRASVGMKMELTTLMAGVGVHAEESLAAGFSLATSSAEITRKATSYGVVTKGFPYKLSAEPSDQPEALPITTEGTVFGSPPPATIIVDLALVLKRGAQDISGAMAIVLRPTLDEKSVSAAGEFVSYCYTPGNLLSYQGKDINKQMKKLFSELDKNTQDTAFKINGTDYSSLYKGEEDYVTKAVSFFGSKSFGPDGNMPYLEFAFSETGIQRSSFQTTSAFTVGGSAFIDGSYYAGLGLDLETSVGALGVVTVPVGKMEGYTVLGCEFSTELAASGTASSEWGVNLGEYLNPLGPGEAYTVRMYLLKPSPLWAREIQHFGQLKDDASIDTINSSPVRIMFTVPYISAQLTARLNALFPGSADLND